MRTQIGFVVLMLALALAATSAQADERTAESDRDAILDIIRTGPLNIGRDTAAWEANFHSDWTVWFAGQAEPRERGPHMQAVREYVARGARVTAFDIELVSLDVDDDRALIRFNAVEQIDDPDVGERVVHYSAVAFLVHEQGRWQIYRSSLSFPAGYEVAAPE